MNKTKLTNIIGNSVDFFEYKIDETQYYEFDTSRSGPPEPMVNAMVGLKLLDTNDKKLVMINMHAPKGLFPKIANDYSWEIEELDSGDVKVIFSRKDATSQTTTDFNNNSCGGSNGGGC